MFRLCLEAYNVNRPIKIYLDGIDEAGEETATSIIMYFQRLPQRLKARISLCFSSRPYPFVEPKYDFAISVQDENIQDVESIADHYLGIAEARLSKTVLQPTRHLLIKSSRGLLLFLARNAPKVVQRIMAEESPGLVLKALMDTPKKPEENYKRDLEYITPENTGTAFEVFKWSCLSLDPLLLEELHIPVCIDSTKKLW